MTKYPTQCILGFKFHKHLKMEDQNINLNHHKDYKVNKSNNNKYVDYPRTYKVLLKKVPILTLLESYSAYQKWLDYMA